MALAVCHELLDGVAGRGRKAEADGGEGDDGEVGGLGQTVDDWAAVGGVLDDAGPAPDYAGMGGAWKQGGKVGGDVAHQRRADPGRNGHAVGFVKPLMRAAAIGKVAAPGLAAVEPIAVGAGDGHQRQRLGDDHLGAGGDHGDGNPQQSGELAGLRPGGKHEMIATQGAAVGLHAGDPPGGRGET